MLYQAAIADAIKSRVESDIYSSIQTGHSCDL